MIIVDHRERNYKDPNYSIPNLLGKLGVPFEKKQLSVGDYVIFGEVLSACVELKNAGDYIASVLSGRLNDELLNISSNYDYGVLLIYGSPTDALMDRELKRSIWFNFLASCVTDISPVGLSGKISVIHVETDFDAANFLSTLHKKISTGNIHREPSSKKVKMPKNKERLYSIMWMFPSNCHIGKNRAQSLVTHYRSIRNLVNTTEEELQTIDKIGPLIAKRMVEHITSIERPKTKKGGLI